MRLIDATAYRKQLNAEAGSFPYRSPDFINGIEVAIADLGDMPTIDAVPVVRCKDCKHCIWFEEYAGSYYPFCTTYAVHIGENDFCSFGERKDGAEDG